MDVQIWIINSNYIQCLASSGCERAHFTLIRRFSCVSAFVSLHIKLSNKSLDAELTFERSFTSVRPHMNL